MKSSKKLGVLLLIIAVIVAAALIGFLRLNRYQTDGTLVLAGLKAPVTVIRDEKGMPYIRAQNIHDALMALGFVTAQDRLFQMELTKLFATGRLAELAGAGAEDLDARMRTIGFHRQAKRQAEMLNSETRGQFQKYLDGVNAYIKNKTGEHHLEFKLAGIKPGPWELSDSLAILFYMSWNSAANIYTEVVAQMLVERLGLRKAREIFPLNVNPDRESENIGRAPVRPAAPRKAA